MALKNKELLKYMGGVKELKISDDVEEYFRFVVNDPRENEVVISYAEVQKYSREALGKLYSNISCVFKNSIEYNLDDNKVYFRRDGWVNSKIPVKIKLIKKWVNECKHDILGIGFNILNSKLGGHANMIVLNKKLKTIEHFEPHGELHVYGNSDIFNKKVKSFFKDCCFPDYEYVEPTEVCPRIPRLTIPGQKAIGVQTIQNQTSDKLNNPLTKSIQGSCAWWSMWYLNVRIVHPEMTAQSAYNKAFNLMAKVTNLTSLGKDVESFIITFIKRLLTIAKFKFIKSDNTKFFRFKRPDGSQYFNSSKNDKDDEIVERNLYQYKISIAKAEYNIFTTLSSEFFKGKKSSKKETAPKKSSKKETAPKKSSKKETAPKKSSKGAKCPPGKIINPKTGRCVSKDGKIGKELLKNSKKSSKGRKQTPKKSSKGAKCPPGKIVNPKTGRCVKKDGKVGKQLLK